MSRRTPDTEMEADIDLEPDRSRFGAFLRGTALALVACAAAAVVVSLVAPLPEDLPRPGRVQVVGVSPAPGPVAPEIPAPDAPSESSAPDADAAAPAAGVDAATGVEVSDPAAIVPDAAGAPASDAGGSDGARSDGTLEGPATASGGGDATTAPEEATTGDPGPEAAMPAAGDGEPAAETVDGASGPDASASPPTGGALAENARSFDAPPDAPLMAVVLVGDAVEALTPERLSLLTMPLNVAIPIDAADPLGLAAAARDSGHEVMIDVTRSEGTAEPFAPVLDLAVAATATGDSAAESLGPVLEALAPRGLAWVDSSVGFATPAERLARGRGMAYTQGNREVAGDASPEQIYRAIDSTAQQARQWGTAVLLLEATEPALQALVRWGLEQRGDSAVWFAPISAVIARRGER